MLEREGRKSRVGHERSAHFCIRDVQLKDLPEPISGSNDRYIKALEPSVDYCAGFGTRQRSAYGSRICGDAHEGEQGLPGHGYGLFGVDRGIEP